MSGPVIDGVYRAAVDQWHAQYSGRRTIIAIDGDSVAAVHTVAAGIREAVIDAGYTVQDESVTSVITAMGARADVAIPFRSDPAGADVLIVTGWGLLQVPARGLWDWTIWASTGVVRAPVRGSGAARAFAERDEPRSAANAIIDVSNPDAPFREWNDTCTV
ncbi:hypothetical protein [Curtobacterium sp. RRHDQ10]|uniref:hypothetical protein n=1 Tax=Curtobacterium phyllosphaerae TaxID=3413379 RepID=UPI003BF1D8D2